MATKGLKMRPLLRYAVLYALTELAALALLIWAVGLGWTLVILAVTFIVGVLLAASQVKGQVAAVRRRRRPQSGVADGALVGVGSVLVFMPGIVTTAAGALMLAPPTRAAMRPLAQTLLTRGVIGRIDLDRYIGQPVRGDYIGDYIDGEVLGEVYPDRLPARR